MPDKSANGMFEYAKSKGMDWGSIDTIPEIPGIAVRLNGHVGVYVGNGYVVEEKGFAYGCVKTKLSASKWLNWYKIPGIIYNEIGVTQPITQIKLGDRQLKKDITGADVKELQTLLNELMQAGLKTDGDFGEDTYIAVKNFQKKYGLNPDGIYGAKSHAKLMEVIGDRQPGNTETEPEPTPTPTTNNKLLTTTGNVNVRAGDSTSYNIITTLAVGAQVEPILDKNNNPIISSEGWYAIKCPEQIGWVSGKYIKG